MSDLGAVSADGHPLQKENTGDIIRKVAWRLMPLIMLCYLFAFFDRINISFAKFQLQSDLGFTDTAYGLGASLFVIGYVLFEVPSNLMLYKVGARNWIARIMISWGLATTAMVFVSNEWQFYGLRFIIGAMEAGFAPGVLYYLTLWFPASYRGRITSLLFLASAFSGLVGAPLSGLVLGHLNGVLGMPGWHWLFLLGGLPCVLLGILVLKVLKDRIDDAGWLTASEKTYLKSQIASQSKPAPGGHSLLGALRTPGFLTLGLVYFLIQIASYGLNFWAPHLIRAAGTDNPTIIGLLTAVPYICGAICMVVVGRMSDRSGERRKFVCGLLLMAAVGLLRGGHLRQADGASDRRARRDGRGRGCGDSGVLGTAAEASYRCRRGRRHRADQYARAAWRHREPGDGRTHPRPYRQHDACALRDRLHERGVCADLAVRAAAVVAAEG